MTRFDYRIQVWVVNGVVRGCGHPASMRPGGEPCCNAYYYAGRPIVEVPGAEGFPPEAGAPRIAGSAREG